MVLQGMLQESEKAGKVRAHGAARLGLRCKETQQGMVGFYLGSTKSFNCGGG
jgi:hypothetical protein